MTQEADQIRSERKEFARPGGSHDRLVRLLATLLPAAVGVVAALMILTPLSPRGEVSFLLDRTKVAIANDRLRVDNAMYRGEDNRGRPFSLTAGQAVQSSARDPQVRMADLVARIMLEDGPAMVRADSATRRRVPGGSSIWPKTRAVSLSTPASTVSGSPSLKAALGFTDVTVDLEEQVIRSGSRVEGAGPAGTFSADSIVADIVKREISLVGNARLSMVPGRLALP